jgi:hypothetical protein
MTTSVFGESPYGRVIYVKDEIKRRDDFECPMYKTYVGEVLKGMP